ncbi:MAG: glycoside hydrolase family 97 catalytic domain-containing protein, partial [Bacteroidota bacterium]
PHPQMATIVCNPVDVAQQMGWNYSLVDANWNRMKNGSLEQLAKYAQTKDIGLLAWYNSGGPHNTVEEAPRDLMLDADMRKQEFERLQKMGIRGIKVDFFQSDKQAIIQQYIDLLEDAATYQLLVNFHGCTLPRGWRRTYPHLMTMEAVRGGECYIFAPEYPTRGPAHISALPFTRGVVGPTDYTPGGFSNNNHPHLTTHGFELALPFLIESGITHMVEKPAALQSLPDFAQELLRELPVVWDETRFIAGYPGKEAVLARRKANKWYISGINGEAKSKALDVDLSSLLEGSASISIIRDGQKVDDLILEKKQLDQTPLRLDLPAYGGFVILADAKSS